METTRTARKPYPSDVSDDEWAFVAPYLTLMREDAPQRAHSLREVFNGLRWIVRTGAAWRLLPHDLPPWYTVYQQAQACEQPMYGLTDQLEDIPWARFRAVLHRVGTYSMRVTRPE